MNKPPTLSPWTAQVAFDVAYRLTPRGERVWIREMGLEYAFLEPGARLRWLCDMVRLALSLRAARFNSGKSKHLWTTSLGLGALFVALVVLLVPLRPALNNAGLERTQSPETYKAATNSPAGSQSSEAETQARAAFPSTVAPSTRAAAPAEVPSSSLTVPLEENGLSEKATTEPRASEPVMADAAAPTMSEAAPATPIVTRVASSVVTLRLTAEVRLELRQGAADGPLLEQGTFRAGRNFTVEVPFYLSISNAGGVSARAGQEELGNLGLEGEPQTRVFILP